MGCPTLLPPTSCILFGVKRLRVGVLYGGRSGEHEVSLASAAAVFAHLDKKRYEAVPIRIEKDGRWCLADRAPTAMSAGEVIEQARLDAARPLRSGREVHMIARPSEETVLSIDRSATRVDELGRATVTGLNLDVIFPVLHGPYGEDGTVQGLLELANVPYVGAGVLASAVGMDKAIMKLVFAAHGLPVGAYRVVLRHERDANPAATLDLLETTLGYPMFVKPANLGSSVGISKAKTRDGLAKALDPGRQLRSQDRGRSGGPGGARDRVRGARQRPARGVGGRRSDPVARVLRLRSEVHRRQLAASSSRPIWSRRSPIGSGGCRSRRSRRSTAPGWPGSTSCCRAGPDRSSSTR